jgi:hypothetical protein
MHAHGEPGSHACVIVRQGFTLVLFLTMAHTSVLTNYASYVRARRSNRNQVGKFDLSVDSPPSLEGFTGVWPTGGDGCKTACFGDSSSRNSLSISSVS